MKQIVLGTAGHIDHGKTTLIKALTGIETDRLKEEKARGITIELGFAYLDLSGGERLGIVDVPGHEKFVKNMVAGAAGIDLVALVIAADEGVMPQTREHLDICKLLGVQHGLIVLTKIDMVDEEWLELVTEDVAEYVEGTFLEDAPIIPVSGVSGQGIPELKDALAVLVETLDEQPAEGPFRLPVDRVFTMKGFGTVITGTATGGQIAIGQEVSIYPRGVTAKVRGLQVHNQEVTQARRGPAHGHQLAGRGKGRSGARRRAGHPRLPGAFPVAGPGGQRLGRHGPATQTPGAHPFAHRQRRGFGPGAVAGPRRTGPRRHRPGPGAPGGPGGGDGRGPLCHALLLAGAHHRRRGGAASPSRAAQAQSARYHGRPGDAADRRAPRKGGGACPPGRPRRPETGGPAPAGVHEPQGPG